MKMERPILFTTKMVKALLNTKPNVWPPEPIDPTKPYKWQTRRVIKPQPPNTHDYNRVEKVGPWYHIEADSDIAGHKDPVMFTVKCPYGQPGDILWVRETWYYENHMYDPNEGAALHRYVYRADYPDYPVSIGVGEHGWRPSIHMPREAARLYLQVKNIRVERLQELAEEDARAEGVNERETRLITNCTVRAVSPYVCYSNAFANLWDKINAKRGYGWETNPWPWVIEFQRVS